MRKLFSYLVLSCLIILSVDQAHASRISATIEWTEEVHDFGSIPQKVEASYEFVFKNPGMIPLIIENVESSCGCTVPTYPKAPIPPGGKGKIKVVYNAQETGYFSKEITVYTNTQHKYTKLQIKGIVEVSGEN